jgi:DNA-binding transcriptional LysR family regulator
MADPISGRDLVAFVAAVEAGTYEAAAERLGLTQSAVTKRVQSLERRIGRSVLERGRRGVRPNSAGRLLYPEAKRVLTALGGITDVLGQLTTDEAVRLAATPTVGHYLLSSWLVQFREARGDVPLRSEVEILSSPAVVAGVRRHEFDLGFVEDARSTGGLQALTLLHDELVVVVSQTHRWARRRSISASELSSEPYFTRERDSWARTLATDALDRAGLKLAPAFVASRSTEGLKRALYHGGFTVLSATSVASEVASGTLHALTVRDADFGRTISVVRGVKPAQDSIAAGFWKWLERHLTGKMA